MLSVTSSTAPSWRSILSPETLGHTLPIGSMTFIYSEVKLVSPCRGAFAKAMNYTCQFA